MTWECLACHGRGKILHPTQSLADPISVVCAHCGVGSAYVWCAHCRQGGQIAEADFATRPLVWACRQCQLKHDLPIGFYDVHIRFSPDRFQRRPLFRARRHETDLPAWIQALDRRWKFLGEPLLVVSGFVLILSLAGLGLTFSARLGDEPILIFYSFTIVFFGLVVGVTVWGSITALFKWIMLHVAPEQPKSQKAG